MSYYVDLPVMYIYSWNSEQLTLPVDTIDLISKLQEHIDKVL